MQIFLDDFAETLPPDEVAVMVADQAGWHGAKSLKIPANVKLEKIPAYTPEVNPMQRVWLHLEERFLLQRLHNHYDSIVDAICAAWNKLKAETARTTSLCTYPWLKRVLAAVRI